MDESVQRELEEVARRAMGRRALEAIAAHILTVPPERVDMMLWCGTACCALGHGLGLQEVRATGLHLVPLKTVCSWEANTHYPALGELRGQAAIAAAFAIPEETSAELFGGRRGTREGVANGIRNYLACTA